MIHIDSMVKALRLPWLKQIFNDSESSWKTYLLYPLKDVGLKFLSAIIPSQSTKNSFVKYRSVICETEHL